MAIDPAAISASPPTITSRVLCNAPDNPAASAKGTVRPSDIPMTTSRTKLLPVKCASVCLMRCTQSDLRMKFQVFQRAARHIFFAAIGQSFPGIAQWDPESALHLYAHFFGNIVNSAGLIFQKIKTDNFINTRPIAPCADVNVLYISQLGYGSSG